MKIFYGVLVIANVLHYEQVYIILYNILLRKFIKFLNNNKKRHKK